MQREQLEQLLSSNSILRSTLLMLYLKTSKSSNFEDFHQRPLFLSPLLTFFFFLFCNSSLYGTRTLCDTGATLYQLS